MSALTIRRGRSFATLDDVVIAHDAGIVNTQSPIKLRYEGVLIDLEQERNQQDLLRATPRHVRQVISTTVGRVIFNQALPEGMPFVNGILKKKGLQSLVSYCQLHHGLETTVRMLDSLKAIGFLYAMKAGISIGIDDLVTPPRKAELIAEADREVARFQREYEEGSITDGERYNKVIATWSQTTEAVAKEMNEAMKAAEKNNNELNPIMVMADSGARGSAQQIRQLAGMRGLMAKPSGAIIEKPIRANFREGLDVLEYFISTHGARKGLADTALKTADSGYLTRRLVDVAQDVIVSEEDCGTIRGIWVEAISEGRNHRTAARPDRRAGGPR